MGSRVGKPEKETCACEGVCWHEASLCVGRGGALVSGRLAPGILSLGSGTSAGMAPFLWLERRAMGQGEPHGATGLPPSAPRTPMVVLLTPPLIRGQSRVRWAQRLSSLSVLSCISFWCPGLQLDNQILCSRRCFQAAPGTGSYGNVTVSVRGLCTPMRVSPAICRPQWVTQNHHHPRGNAG